MRYLVHRAVEIVDCVQVDCGRLGKHGRNFAVFAVAALALATFCTFARGRCGGNHFPIAKSMLGTFGVTASARLPMLVFVVLVVAENMFVLNFIRFASFVVVAHRAVAAFLAFFRCRCGFCFRPFAEGVVCSLLFATGTSLPMLHLVVFVVAKNMFVWNLIRFASFVIVAHCAVAALLAFFLNCGGFGFRPFAEGVVCSLLFAARTRLPVLRFVKKILPRKYVFVV